MAENGSNLPLLLTQVEACKLLGRSPKTVRRWGRLGLIPTFIDPDSGRTFYPRPALERWAASMSVREGDRS